MCRSLCVLSASASSVFSLAITSTRRSQMASLPAHALDCGSRRRVLGSVFSLELFPGDAERDVPESRPQTRSSCRAAPDSADAGARVSGAGRASAAVPGAYGGRRGDARGGPAARSGQDILRRRPCGRALRKCAAARRPRRIRQRNPGRDRARARPARLLDAARGSRRRAL